MIIGIDLQTLETPEANRGIGRCTRGFVEHFVRAFPEHRVIGFGFSPTPPNALNCGASANFEYRRFELPRPREDYLNDGIIAPFGWSPNMRDLDLYLVTSPLMFDILLPDGGPFPIASIVYDLIPLLYRRSHPDQMTEHMWLLYDARRDLVAQYDYLLPISDAVRAELVRYLSVKETESCAIGVGVGEEFFKRLPAGAFRRLQEDCGVRSPYVLSVTGHHYRKNWEAVFQVFAALPPEVRKQHQLVVVCLLDAPSRHAFQSLAEQLGIEKRVVLTGGVDDETLLALYQGAAALLFPSFSEGFGIPLTEAMASGVPIVASDIPVFREVAQSAARLVDPTRIDALSEALHEVLIDKETCSTLVDAGRRRVEEFRWPKVVQRAESFLSEKLHASHRMEHSARSAPAGDRLRVAYFTPLPPQVSGIADYNECLVQELDGRVDLELFLDDVEPLDSKIHDGMRWRDSRDFPLVHRNHPYDLIVYQMGNNVIHGLQYRYATTYPGVVLLHDYSLRFFVPLLNQRFSFCETRDHVEHYYGMEFPPTLSPEHILGQLDLIEHPLNERLIERSLGIVVHSTWNRDLIRRRFPDTPVEVVPFGVDFERRERIASPDDIRTRYGIGADAFVVTCAGNLTPTKRLTTILHAFAELLDQIPEAQLLLVGRTTAPEYAYRLRRLAADLKLGGCVHFIGYVDMNELYDVLDITDVCLNLRYPTLGETSGMLLRMMQRGKPIIVTAVGQFLEFPDSVCWKVDVGGAEQRQLVRLLVRLGRSTDVREALGKNALRFAQERTWDKVAGLHVEAWQRIARHAHHQEFSTSD